MKEFVKNFVESLLEGVKAKVKSIVDNGVSFHYYHSSPLPCQVPAQTQIHAEVEIEAPVQSEIQAHASNFRQLQPPSTLVNYSLSESSESNEPPIVSGQTRRLTLNDQNDSNEEPSSKRTRASNNNQMLNVTFTVGPAASSSIQVDFNAQYRLVLEEFLSMALNNSLHVRQL